MRSTATLEKLRFHPNWEVRRDTLFYVRDNARKKDPRVMATLKHMARRDPNVNVKLAAAEILVHVGLQTLPEQIWCPSRRGRKTPARRVLLSAGRAHIL